MTISLCPVLMNFSMQITHLNQKGSPVLFVVRQLRRQENQPPARWLHGHHLCFSFLLLQIPTSLREGVWSGRWGGTAVRPKQLKPQVFGIRNDVNAPLCFVPHIQDWETRPAASTNRKARAECNDSVSTQCVDSQGTGFSVLNICTCFTSLYFHTPLPRWRRPRSCFLFLWGLTGRRALAEGGGGGSKRRHRRFTSVWILHFEDEVHEYV